MDKSSSPSCSACGPWWRLPLLLAFVLAAILLSRGFGVRESTELPDSTAASPPAAEAVEKVSLTIDFGDGRRQQYEPIAWREGMTVQDLLRETPRDNLHHEIRGTGASTFLVNLDGTANEGAEGRNWTYAVNGKHGDRSFAVYDLRPGDQVLWSFGAQQ